MKKLLIILTVFIIGGVICLFIFIPGELKISGVVGVKSSYTAINRCLPNKTSWQKWWPGILAEDSSFTYKKDTYKIQQQFLDGLEIEIKDNNREIKSKLSAIKIDIDSSLIEWRCSIENSFSPFSRISNYLLAKKMKSNFDSLLLQMKPFLQIQQNIYGITIKQTSTTDTLLICTKSIYDSYPHTQEANLLVDKLKNYIAKQNAVQTAGAMMNISKADGGKYQMMIAIPTNKQLKNEGDFFFRKMVPGHFLMAEVKGGEFTVSEGMRQMSLYMQDYERTSMAIPFQLFVTDRSIEEDTSKWVTKIYFPVY